MSNKNSTRRLGYFNSAGPLAVLCLIVSPAMAWAQNIPNPPGPPQAPTCTLAQGSSFCEGTTAGIPVPKSTTDILGPNGEANPYVVAAPITNIVTSTTYKNTTNTTTYASQSTTPVSTVGGQDYTTSTTTAATYANTTQTPTVTTSTPKAAGGFTVSDPIDGTPTQVGTPTVSNVGVTISGSTKITEISGTHSSTEHTPATAESAEIANVTTDKGQLNLDGVTFTKNKGLATLDRDNNQINVSETSSVKSRMDSTGLYASKTTSDQHVEAGVQNDGVYAYTDIKDANGNSVSSTGTLLDTTGIHITTQANTANPSAGNVTDLTLDGLVTTGSVKASSIASTGGIIAGGIVSLVTDGVALTDAVNLGQLRNAISTEVTNRDTAIGTAISTEVINRDTAIGTAISTEVTNRDAAIGTAISTEVTNRDAAIDTAITTEVTNRDTAIGTAISTEVTNRDTAIGTAISTEVTNRNTAINAEVTRATGAEGVLTASVTTEVTRATGAETALGIRVTGETVRATAAEGVLTASVTSEVTRATGAETALGARVTTEMSRATAAEGAEITARAAAMSAEQDARSSADAALGVRVTGETTRATNAETALGGRIDTTNTRITILTEQVKKDIAAATAVSVALGGNSFLPGKKFNLTVNVGSYDGESALAAQFGFMVNDSLAINGGVASGFGSGSSTAVRGGFTYGW